MSQFLIGLGLLLALAAVAGAALYMARRSGRDAAEKKEAIRNVEAAKRIAEGAQDKPADRTDLADRIRRGDF